jgi:S-adenosylmethionine synthetase
VAYAIGEREPLSILVDTFGTGRIPDVSIVELVAKEFDLTPHGIIDKLQLRRPIYRQTAAYGHFGRSDSSLPWELTDMADTLRKKAGY